MSANNKYKELCIQYGHLAYTKKCIEEQMIELEKKMSLLADLSKEEAAKTVLKETQSERSQ